MDSDRIDYPRIIQEALRDVVRRVLVQVLEHGLPGEHHLYLGFRTADPGVEIPLFLRQRYPEEMVVVLQNQFWDLDVGPDSFSVVLNFDARRHRLAVPYAAITTFVDPSVQFALRFDAPLSEEAAAEEAAREGAGEPADKEAPAAEPEKPSDPSRAGDVLRFDPSRRR